MESEVEEMGETEKQKVKELVDGLTEEQIGCVVHLIPSSYMWNELRRREEQQGERLKRIAEALGEEENGDERF